MDSSWNLEDISRNGAVCIIEDVPVGMEFGCDLNCWSVAENFKGMKMIPPGFHCIYYNVNSISRQGFLIYTQDQEIILMKYDRETESIKRVSSSPDLDSFYRSNIPLWEKHLAIFPYDVTYTKWKSLTCHLERTEVLELMRTSCVSSEDTKVLNLSQFDVKLSFPKGGDPMTITKYSIDKSYLLESLLSRYSEERIMAEFQLGFLLFSLLQNEEGFETWKRWLLVCLNCDEAIPLHRDFFETFISCLQVQISESPPEIFHEFFEKQTFLSILLKRWWYSLRLYDQNSGTLMHCTRKLLDSIESNSQLRFTHEHLNEVDDEDEPCSVALSESEPSLE